QPAHRVLVQLVFPAEAVQQLRHRPAAGGVPLVMRQVQVANLAALDLPGRRLHVHRSRDYSGKPGRNDEAASTVSLEVSSRVPRARATDLRTLPLGTSRTRNYAELRPGEVWVCRRTSHDGFTWMPL